MIHSQRKDKNIDGGKDDSLRDQTKADVCL